MERPRVTGIGGIFFKARDPEALGTWYRDKLGFDVEKWGGSQFFWNRRDAEGGAAYTVWNPFKESTEYFSPSERSYMINLRVDDLEAMLKHLKASGAHVLDRRDETEQGKFGYVLDPDGTLLELWEPAATDPALPK
ncbi:MAG TPA: VOC family protein [Polyangiaceae bacterium]|jgi:catechol 2,3-dioxygenase-like lactoylglutathione lyase family enzyme|nr:VOC family protein [Polyangiaceae bacterium]